MPYSTIDELPSTVRNALPNEAQRVFMRAYNSAEQNEDYSGTEQYNRIAWGAVKNAGYEQDSDGNWIKKNIPAHKVRVSMTTKVAEIEEEKRRCFGWGYVSEKAGVEVVDHSEESASIDEVEEGAYAFNKEAQRPSGAMHITDDGAMIESMVFTKDKWEALGVDASDKPLGWWVGFEFDEGSSTWKGIKEGRYKMFSLEGEAIRELVEELA